MLTTPKPANQKRITASQALRMHDSVYGAPLQEESRRLARVRFHQAWFRVHVLGLIAFGSTPSGKRLGSILTIEDGNAGRNFVSGEACELYRSRRSAGWGLEPVRCERHMTSSQTLTVNLAALLHEDLEVSMRVMAAITGREDFVSIDSIHLEYAPASPSQHLGDKSRIDLLIGIATRAGNEFIAMEIKYADRFNSRAIDLRTDPYIELIEASNVWGSKVSLEPRSATNQLLRCHALATSLSLVSFGHTDTTFILLTLDDDDLATVIAEEYSGNLMDPTRFIHLKWTNFFEQFQAVNDRSGLARRLRGRYVDWDLSEPAWRSLTETCGLPDSSEGERLVYGLGPIDFDATDPN